MKRPDRADLERLDRQLQVVNRRSGKQSPCRVYRPSHLHVLDDVSLEESKIGAISQVGNIVRRAGQKVVDAEDLVSLLNETLTQMGAKKSRLLRWPRQCQCIRLIPRASTPRLTFLTQFSK